MIADPIELRRRAVILEHFLKYFDISAMELQCSKFYQNLYELTLKFNSGELQPKETHNE